MQGKNTGRNTVLKGGLRFGQYLLVVCQHAFQTRLHPRSFSCSVVLKLVRFLQRISMGIIRAAAVISIFDVDSAPRIDRIVL